jgi:molybdate transport system ATP-binding protein
MHGITGNFSLQLTQFNLKLDFELPGRGVTAIFGSSGSGKTTLLRCIAGLERARGYLAVNGSCWQDTTKRLFLPTHQRPLGYVFQEASLFQHLSVKKNLDYGLSRVSEQDYKVAKQDVIELLGIEHLLTRSPERLSGGEKQRVAIARALLTSPKLLLMDEPLSALDASSKAEILPYLEKLHAELSIPVLYITHAMPEVMRLADYMLVINQGKVLSQGDLSEVLTRLDLALTHADDAGVVIAARVVAYDEPFHLTYLEFNGGGFSIFHDNLPVGQTVRVRVLARDVSLALENETRSSILNIFQTEITDLMIESPGQVLIKLRVQDTALLARISLKSSNLLKLHVGMLVYARVKSVALV